MDSIILITVASLTMAAPLIAAALGGLFSERSGVVNIGIEGMMTFGAFIGALTVVQLEATYGQGFWVLIVGTLSAMIAGGFVGLLHAWLSIKCKLDQIISGTAINIAALAVAIYLSNIIFMSAETPAKLTPGIKIFGEVNLVVIVIFLSVFLTAFIVNKTRFGMRMIAVGENPQAADAMGINVNRIRYQAVIISGIFSGLAGMAIVLTTTSRFAGYVVAGKGFIALAVMLFGRRNPYGILGAGLLFGLTSTLGTFINVIAPDLPINGIYFQILPYVVTIIALAVFSKSTIDPEGLGKAYDKEER